jgi:P-type Ca2+ transporter type 2B
MWRNIFGHGIY